MTEWSEWIGDAANLQAKSVEDALGKAVKFFLLARREGIHDDLSDQYGEEYEDPYFRFETLFQVNNPKNKDDDPPHYTYEYDEEVPVKKNGKSVSSVFFYQPEMTVNQYVPPTKEGEPHFFDLA